MREKTATENSQLEKESGVYRMKGNRKGKNRGILRIALKIVGILVLLVYVAVPVGFGIYATRRFAHDVGEPPEKFEEVSLRTEDGVDIGAWYAPPENGASIILVHGATSSREAIRGYAEVLERSGYGVLAFDLRGHGESGGDGVNSFGWKGHEDVGAALDFLLKKAEVRTIGALGLSLGGEVLLHAASAHPEIEAVMADGATFLSLEDYLTLPSNQSFLRSYTNRVVFGTAELFGGPPPEGSIADSIMAAKETRFLLVAAGEVQSEVDYNSMFAKIDASRCALWIAEGAGHTEAFARDPEGYAKRLVGFFDAQLLVAAD